MPPAGGSQESTITTAMTDVLTDAKTVAKTDAKTVAKTDAKTDVMTDAECRAVLNPPDTLANRVTTFIGVVGPFIGLLVAMYALWGWAFSPVYRVLLIVMSLASGLGITIGYHRLVTHRAIKTSRTVEFVLGVLGSMAVEGPLLRWVATHRCHHRHSDERDDPHSPNHFGGGVFGVISGWWHAHMGWIFIAKTIDLTPFVPDLRADKLLRTVSRLFPVWVLLGFLIPAVLGGVITLSWTGALLGFLWGGVVRVFIVHHATWSINSVCHLWGQRPFESRDESRNNFLCGVLAFGEGWHNNHHAFPSSARHGLRWWEFDMSYTVIRGMELVGIAWRVRRPTLARIAARRAR